MKAILVLMMVLAGALLTPVSLRAEEAEKEMKCACMKGHDDKKEASEKKVDAEAVELQKLVDEMNATTGDKKLEAMAAVLNKVVQSHKEMRSKIGGIVKKDGEPQVKPEAEHGEVDYYTCKMHPAVHWPVPVKCPICSMDLVPVFKKGSEAKPDAKNAKPGEDIKKADDSHAEHKH